MYKAGKPIIPTNGIGTAPDAAVTGGGVEVSFDAGANRSRQATFIVMVTNMEATTGNTLEVSFNNNGRWFAVATNTTIEFPVVRHRIRLRGTSGGTAAYSVMGLV
jgi:hypothetical protein